MRTFVAIPLPDRCREMLDRLQKNLRSTEADVRWVAIPSIHLTLKFLGEVDPAIIPQLAGSFRNIKNREQELRLRIQGLGGFPNARNPRVIWCGIEGDTDGLLHLQQEVENVCAAFGFAAENRPFSPHLTLGRVKSKRNLQPLVDCIKIGSDLECSFGVNRYNIYRSTLNPKGAIYTVLETIDLCDSNT